VGIIISRSRLRIFGFGTVLAVLFAMWFFQPDRTLERTWNGLIGAVEARHAGAMRGYLAEVYSDRWGYDRETLAADARLAFQHFTELDIRPANIRIERDGDIAKISAMLRLEAAGTIQALDARMRVNALTAPFTTRWRQRPGLLGGWEMTSLDHPELDLRSFRRHTLPILAP